MWRAISRVLLELAGPLKKHQDAASGECNTFPSLIYVVHTWHLVLLALLHRAICKRPGCTRVPLVRIGSVRKSECSANARWHDHCKAVHMVACRRLVHEAMRRWQYFLFSKACNRFATRSPDNIRLRIKSTFIFDIFVRTPFYFPRIIRNFPCF